MLTGYEVVPNNSNSTMLPAIIVLPDWDGVNTYEIERARLASTLVEPYVTFAADIYGSDKQNITSSSEMSTLANMYRNNVTLYNGRIKAAIDTVKMLPGINPQEIVVIGYCFGGTGVLNYAISGADDVVGVVSFHGGLTNRFRPGNSSFPVTASVLVQSGGSDDTASSIEQLELDLNSTNATWEMSRYSNVVHGFTDWYAGTAYSPRADMRSWRSMITFLSVLFSGGNYSGSQQPPDITLPLPPPSSTTSSSPSPSSSSSSAGVIVGVVIAIVFVLAILVIICVIKRKQISQTSVERLL